MQGTVNPGTRIPPVASRSNYSMQISGADSTETSEVITANPNTPKKTAVALAHGAWGQFPLYDDDGEGSSASQQVSETFEATVLLIEDNDGDYVLTREMMAEATSESIVEGVFSLQRVSRLADAFEVLQSSPVSVVLLDLSLPDASGLEALRQLKERAPATPIVLLTGFDDLKLAKQALSEGAQDYLIKGRVDAALLSRAILYAIERKRAETERIALEERLMVSRKLESLGMLAGGLAHDLNNLMQGILTHTSLAIRNPERQVTCQKLTQIETLVGHASELLAKLLSCSDRVRFSSDRLDLHEFATETLKLVQETLPPRVDVVMEKSQGVPAVDVDRMEIRQVIINLISNAVDAIGDRSGTVRISTGAVRRGTPLVQLAFGEKEATAESYVYIEVADTGRGMDTTTQTKICEPFFTTKRSGRGLGMASVLGIVRGHGGAMTVDSAVGKGTSIRALFPASIRN